MNKLNPLVPMRWLLLDMVGACMIFWAALEYFHWVQWWPQSWHWPFYQLIMMMIGLFLMTPYQILLLMAITKRMQNLKKTSR